MLAAKNSHDIILTTETWLAGCSSSQTNRPNRTGGGSLACTKQAHDASALHYPMLEPISGTLWLHMQLLELLIHIECKCRPPNSNNFDVYRLTQAILYLSGPTPSRKIIAGDIDAPKICWSFSSAHRTLLNFVLETHDEGWAQHAAALTKFSDIFELVFTRITPNIKVPVVKLPQRATTTW